MQTARCGPLPHCMSGIAHLLTETTPKLKKSSIQENRRGSVASQTTISSQYIVIVFPAGESAPHFSHLPFDNHMPTFSVTLEKRRENTTVICIEKMLENPIRIFLKKM